ncbi:hypothetical protein RchiOBHm_Chr1g0323631 [Rosa chinensis]|uniref:Uncharacterized protein n=1 Tax=Rosa chinensis TaxID=74649 RepID=A0A2P6S9H6_ROSCH|nr:hypothetical protein RchiOBHm_Chr1g0323631 [Rosa chinensis]
MSIWEADPSLSIIHFQLPISQSGLPLQFSTFALSLCLRDWIIDTSARDLYALLELGLDGRV